MSKATQYEPIVFEPVSELFHGLFRPLRTIANTVGLSDPDVKMDVLESDTAYMIKADLPGVDKKDIYVKIEGSSVSISAKVEQDKELTEGARAIHRERHLGDICRSFSLASDVDETTASAQYQNGVLLITLPKKTSSVQKRLQIS